jgi:hypothetical protein
VTPEQYQRLKHRHKTDLLFNYAHHRLVCTNDQSPQAVHALAEALEEVAEVLRGFASNPEGIGQIRCLPTTWDEEELVG